MANGTVLPMRSPLGFTGFSSSICSANLSNILPYGFLTALFGSPKYRSFSVACYRTVDSPIRRETTTMVSESQDVIGGPDNFWLHSKAEGFDLTHPATPESAAIYPRIPLETNTAPVTIDSALLS